MYINNIRCCFLLSRYLKLLILFLTISFLALAEQNHKDEKFEIGIKRLYEFVGIINKSIVDQPKKIDNFLVNPSATEGPGETFDFIRKREKGKSYKIDFRSYRDWGKKNFCFGGFNFELIKVNRELRDKNFRLLESKFISLYGKPLVKKNHGDSASMNWLFHEDIESIWYLIIKTKNYRNRKDIGNLKVLLNRVSKDKIDQDI